MTAGRAGVEMGVKWEQSRGVQQYVTDPPSAFISSDKCHT